MELGRLTVLLTAELSADCHLALPGAIARQVERVLTDYGRRNVDELPGVGARCAGPDRQGYQFPGVAVLNIADQSGLTLAERLAVVVALGREVVAQSNQVRLLGGLVGCHGTVPFRLPLCGGS
jgi:hypothetical protein